MHLFERLAMLRVGSIFHISAIRGVLIVYVLFCPYGEAQIDRKKVTARNAQRQLTQVTAELFIVQFQIAQALSGNIPFCYLS
jgi:hypothetical protein